jgi:acyl-coenzyme A thioesterase PaaI-like protein
VGVSIVSDPEHCSFSEKRLFLCGPCHRLGACRLGLVDERIGQDSTATFNLLCTGENEGAPGVAHGGWTAAVFDDLLGRVPMLHGTMAHTGTLNVRFLKPVPVEVPLCATARLDRRERRKWFVSGELMLAETGEELGSGAGTFISPKDPNPIRDRYFSVHARGTIYDQKR